MSLQEVPGGPTRAEAKQFAGPPPGSGVSGKYTTVNPPGSAKDNEFPIVPFAPDKYDTIASIKQSVGDNQNAAFGNKWMVPFTDADAQYMLRQQAQVQNANYERWLWKQYDVTDPAQAWIFQQIAPKQFEKRKQLILYQQNLATKYAMLRLYGVKTEEDLMLKYLVDTKQIELPEGPVWDPKKWIARQSGMEPEEYKEGRNNAQKEWQKRYTMGMFNPLKYVSQKQVGHMPDNRADPLSFTKDKIDAQFFVGSNMPDAPYKDYGKNPAAPNGWVNQQFYDYTKDTKGMGRIENDQ